MSTTAEKDALVAAPRVDDVVYNELVRMIVGLDPSSAPSLIEFEPETGAAVLVAIVRGVPLQFTVSVAKLTQT